MNTAHRIGMKLDTQALDKRSIIVKHLRDTKRQIISASRNDKAIGLFINENLTPLRRNIFYALRQIRRAHPSWKFQEKLEIFCRDFIK